MNRYSATIAEHFEDPRNRQPMPDADAIGLASLGGRPPSVTLYIAVAESQIARASFEAFGCAFLIACCSALTEQVQTQSLAEGLAIRPEDLIASLDGLPDDKRFCALLAVEALHDAIRNHLKTQDVDHES